MPLVCCLSDPVEADVFEGDGEAVVTIPIGYDDTTLCVFSLVVALATFPGASVGMYEQVFYIQEFDPDTDHFHEFWDGRDTQRVVSDRHHRGLVLDALRDATEHLIQLVNPRVVTFMTHGDDLPAKALAKYEMLADTYRHAGYSAVEGERFHGRRIWMAEREH